MPQRTSRRALALAAFPVLLLMGCQTEKIEKLEQQTAELSAELAQTRDSLAETRGSLAATSDELAVATAEQRRLAKEWDEESEKTEKRIRELESHRDELVEWIEDDLLPLAEEHDPRLANLRQITDEMAQQVERLRGLEFKRPFMRRLIDRDDVSKFMRRDMERELPREDAEKMMKVAAEFGLVEKDMDLYEMFEEFLEAGAAAFYKPNTGTFYLIEGKNDQGDRPIVFHELVHAVEDQHFDLAELSRRFDGDSDAGLGFKALVEGSAEYHTNLYTAEFPEDQKAMMKAQMNPELIRKQMEMLNRVPAFLVAMMGLYPYKNGAAWIEGIGATSPEAVNELWSSRPSSTEQVLHPEKHGQDFPHAVAAPDIEPILGDGWELLDDDGMGELGAGLMLSALRWQSRGMGAVMAVMDMRTQGVAFKPPVKKAVEGWDGDRYASALDAAGNVCIVWTTIWDSDQDAQEFATTYGELLGKRVTGEKVQLEAGAPARFSVEAGAPVSGIDVAGNVAVVILSAPADKADDLMAAGLRAEITPDERDANDN